MPNKQTNKQSIGKTLRIWVNKFSVQNRRQAFLSSLRKQPTFGDATTGFPTRWRLRNSILMRSHYPDLGSDSDWLNQISHGARPIRSTTQIWVVTRHQYGLSVLVSQTSFGGETSGSVAKCRLFSILLDNSPYACLLQTSKFNHQSSFWNFKSYRILHKWIVMGVELKRMLTLIKWKWEVCLETRLGGEICSSDVIKLKCHCKSRESRSVFTFIFWPVLSELHRRHQILRTS